MAQQNREQLKEYLKKTFEPFRGNRTAINEILSTTLTPEDAAEYAMRLAHAPDDRMHEELERFVQLLERKYGLEQGFLEQQQRIDQERLALERDALAARPAPDHDRSVPVPSVMPGSGPPPVARAPRTLPRAVRSDAGAVSKPRSFFLAAFLVAAFIAIGTAQWTIALACMAVVVLYFLIPRFRAAFGSMTGILFLLSFVAHAFLFLHNYALNNMIVVLMLLPILLSMIYALLFAPDRREQIELGFMAVAGTILLYALPYIVTSLSGDPTIESSAVLITTLVPLWPLFLLKRLAGQDPDGYAAGLLLWWKVVVGIIIFIVAAYALIRSADALPQFTTSGVDAKGNLMEAFSVLGDMVKKSVTRIGTGVKQATNPGAYYRGQVERNEKEPLGVTIEDFRPQDKNVPNGSDIILHGNVYAKSFLGEKLTVVPSCLIDRKGAPAASVDPPELDIVFSTYGSFSCTFPPMPKIGAYAVKGAVTFPFQTWAYIEYTFVDRERAQAIARQGEDVKRVLDIKPEPKAIYTSGPVMLGMGGTPQPILVDPDAEQILPKGTRLGITLDSNWIEGTLNHVDRLELKVPKAFSLRNCDREITSSAPDLNEPEYTSYVFENKDFSVVTTYTSVTCDLVLEDADAARTLVGSDKTVITFVGVAQYAYTVEDRVSVKVE